MTLQTCMFSLSSHSTNVSHQKRCLSYSQMEGEKVIKRKETKPLTNDTEQCHSRWTDIYSRLEVTDTFLFKAFWHISFERSLKLFLYLSVEPCNRSGSKITQHIKLITPQRVSHDTKTSNMSWVSGMAFYLQSLWGLGSPQLPRTINSLSPPAV